MGKPVIGEFYPDPTKPAEEILFSRLGILSFKAMISPCDSLVQDNQKPNTSVLV